MVALCVAGLGCSDSGDHASEDMMQQMDMVEADVEMAPEDALTEAEQAVIDVRVALAAADKIRDAASYGTEELNRVGDITVTRKLDHWESNESVTGWRSQFQTNNSGSKYTLVAQSYRDGSWGWFLPWYDADGNLQLQIGTGLAHEPLQRDPSVWPWRAADTAYPEPEGMTRSVAPVADHGLGAEWKGFDFSKTYEGVGTLSMRVFTDLAEADNPGDAFSNSPARDATYPDVVLDAPIPALPAGWDGQWIYAGDGLPGSLDGVPGTFSCAEGDRYYCGLETGTGFLAPGYSADVSGDAVVFTPDDGGTEVTLPHPAPTRCPLPTISPLAPGCSSGRHIRV